MLLPEYLDTTCTAEEFCSDPFCSDMVRQRQDTGKWYITIGHAGFNSPANKGRGYFSEAAAKAAIRAYLGL